jgi:HEAT repeat protein
MTQLDEDVHLACALARRVLREPNDHSAVVRLMARLARSEDPGVRCAVAEALGTFELSRESTAILSELAEDRNPTVRAVAVEASEL